MKIVVNFLKFFAFSALTVNILLCCLGLIMSFEIMSHEGQFFWRTFGIVNIMISLFLLYRIVKSWRRRKETTV